MLEVLAENPRWDELILDYPDLEPADIEQALAFAAVVVGERWGAAGEGTQDDH